VTPAGDATPRDPVVVCCADDAYALPLAVAVRSALDHLDPTRVLSLFVVDGGLSARSRERLLRSWPADRVRVRFLTAQLDRLRNVPRGGHISLATYIRILLPELLPAGIERALYLDCDVLVLGDLGRLWDEPLAGALCLAVQDTAAPFIDAELANPACLAGTITPRPIENYAELGLDPRAPYFNSGVMLVDPVGWRAEDVGERLLRCLDANRRHVRFWDQYALNVVLAGRWRALDLRWNVSPYLAGYGGHATSPFARDAFESALREPWIVHFLGPDKPWQAASRLRHADAFHEHRRRTAWRGWLGAGAQTAARVARERRRLRKKLGRARKRMRRARHAARGRLRALRLRFRPAPPG
jgi:lipopolysaccharide biosynthesis glycosyltransferase